MARRVVFVALGGKLAHFLFPFPLPLPWSLKWRGRGGDELLTAGPAEPARHIRFFWWLAGVRSFVRSLVVRIPTPPCTIPCVEEQKVAEEAEIFGG